MKKQMQEISRISPDTWFTEITDGALRNDNLCGLSPEDPYEEVLKALRSEADPDSPRTIEEYKNYILALTVNACGAAHEDAGYCSYTAVDCKLKIKNVGCLHSFDFRRGDSGSYLRVGENIWGLRVFALAYFLNELGYKCPSFINNYQFWQKLQRKYDTLAVGKAWDRDIFSDNFTAEALADQARIKRLQSRAGLYFMGKYIEPVRADFVRFWNEQVDAEPICLNSAKP